MPKQNAPKRAVARGKAAPVKKEPKSPKAAKPPKAQKPQKAARTPKAPGEAKLSGRGKGVILALVILLALSGLYAGLCASVSPDQVLPRTRVVYQSPEAADASAQEVQSLELSGLNRDGLLRTLKEDFHSRYDGRSLTVRAEGTDYIVPVGNSLGLDVDALAEQALAPSQAPFLWRGLSRIRSLMVWRSLKAQPGVENEMRLRAGIHLSGLLEVDTTVQTTYEVRDKQLVLHKGKSGRSVDEDALVQEISKAVLAGDFEHTLDSPMVQGQVNEMDWAAVKKAVCRKVSDASLKLSEDRRDYEIVKSVTGVSFDQKAAQQALEAAGEGADTKVALTYKQPKISTRQMKKKLFQDKLGTFTTEVNGTSNRVSNVRLAAEKCDGIILCKGDEFSYNDTLGERTEDNGFKTAGAYLNGATVQELGGGICQISSTMYAATLNANLAIVERHNHTFASTYIGLGMDATVSWGGPDFKFRNDKDYPIKIEASYWDGYATVTIWGTRTDKLTVEMVSETLETIPFPTVTHEDSSMKKGKTRVSQSGSDGYKVQTYRNIYDDGELVSSEKEAYSVYTPHEEIVYVGTKVEEPKPEPEPGSSKTEDQNKKGQDDGNKKRQDQQGADAEEVPDAGQGQQAAD